MIFARWTEPFLKGSVGPIRKSAKRYTEEAAGVATRDLAESSTPASSQLSTLFQEEASGSKSCCVPICQTRSWPSPYRCALPWIVKQESAACKRLANRTRKYPQNPTVRIARRRIPTLQIFMDIKSARPLSLLVGAGRFERPTPCAQGRCATRLRYAPTFCVCLILNHAAASAVEPVYARL